jgi:hypothetical protein
MGHALRRLRHFDRSAEAIRTALLLVPGRAASRTALAFTLHCQARSPTACEMWAAALRPRCTVRRAAAGW